MLVKEEGGYSKVSKERKWALIARKLGLQWELSENLKITYMSYLDLLEWYYNKSKKNKINMREPSSSGELYIKRIKSKIVRYYYPSGCGPKIVENHVQENDKPDEMSGEDSKGNKEEYENEVVIVENNK
ncbi:hypothetical protein L1987_43249 [Smallanthus sonchifolius]|uniref:Uncharacterized protein n=1 Tax=Smallanthus sonchifolius TaxID=185202 RepID=A0ACB9GL25_9ASTR|nr:hypothetical protein L1987_43249 [Smallanthus sonchifolius]